MGKVRTVTRATVVSLSTLQTATSAAVGVLSTYLGVISTAGFIAGVRINRQGVGTPSPSTSNRRFAILVPAHNEAGGIGATLCSFDQLDYPRQLFDVHIVADNCTDDTVSVIRKSGWNAYERSDGGNPGKGPALNWLYDRLAADGAVFDSVVIVDADTTLDPAFLTAMADALDGGARAAQGFYGVRDAAGSTTVALRYAALACRHHLRPLGRTALGGSSGLYGNGMAFNDDIMRSRRWSGHLTEDMEFQMDLLLDGVRVAYVPGAALQAEMPDSFDGATSQNERWELGRIQMARRYLPTLVDRIRHGERGLRAAYVDSAFDHAVPPLSVLVALNGLCVISTTLWSAVRNHRLDRLNMMISFASAAILTGHVLVGLRSVKAPAAIYRSLFQAPKMIVWKVGLWVRVLLKPDKVTWSRTTRNPAAV